MMQLRFMLVILAAGFSPIVWSEASIDPNAGEPSFLLDAPGTLSKPKLEKRAFVPAFPNQPTSSSPPSEYRYIPEDRFHFNQFGQHNGMRNPWIDKQNRGRQPRPSNAHNPMDVYTNPWAVDGFIAPPDGTTFNLPRQFSPADSMAPGIYGGLNDFYSNFADSVYRDTNPATMGAPKFDMFLPGVDDKGFDFPFSPF